MKSDNIILIGFPGTGKSTVGRLLAERLEWSFTDTDARIEEEQGESIASIFERVGEAGFRRLETEMLLRVIGEGQLVIATGGGAVLAEENRAAMLASGYVVALKADKETIIGRVSANADRPLLRGEVEERVSRLLETRKTAYDFADLTVDTAKCDPQEAADVIAASRREAFR